MQTFVLATNRGLRANRLQLERSVVKPKEHHKRLREELKEIQRQVNEQEGQIKVY